MESLGNDNACRKRTANFTAEETELLLELVKRHRDIVECKQSDRISWNKKNETWLEITKEFNATTNVKVQRHVGVLKKKFENMKKITKKKYMEEKRALYGVGPKVPSSITTIDEELKVLMGVQLDDQDSYNSDAIAGCSIAVEENNSLEEQQDWSEYAPSILRQQLMASNGAGLQEAAEGNGYITDPGVSSAESRPAGRNDKNARTSSRKCKERSFEALHFTDKWEQLAEEKLEFVQMKKKLFKEKHDLEIQYMTEQHELAKQNLKEKQRLEMKYMTEQHDLALQKLKMQIESINHGKEQ